MKVKFDKRAFRRAGVGELHSKLVEMLEDYLAFSEDLKERLQFLSQKKLGASDIYAKNTKLSDEFSRALSVWGLGVFLYCARMKHPESSDIAAYIEYINQNIRDIQAHEKGEWEVADTTYSTSAQLTKDSTA